MDFLRKLSKGGSDHHHDADKINQNQEAKYERVEKVKLDADGQVARVDVTEGIGKEDPAMNFKETEYPPVGPVTYGSDLLTGPAYGREHVGFTTEPILPRETSSTRSLVGSTLVTDYDVDKSKGKEFEYEKVRKYDVDTAGNAELTAAGEHFGREDPRMNWKDSVPTSGEFTSVRNISGPTTVGGLREGSIHDYGSRLETSSSYNSTSSNIGSNIGGTVGSVSSALHSGFPVTGSRVDTLGRQGDIVVSGFGTEYAQRDVEREVITHGTAAREIKETVTIPVTRYESGQMESVREGVTFTQEKGLTIPGPALAAEIIPAPMELHMGGGARAEVKAVTNLDLTEAQISAMGPEEYERYRKKVEKLARLHEFETAEKAAAYRAEVERDAELIRRTLEKQHLRDIEFRKDLVETSIERQQQEIQLEAEYAMRVLEKEREAARNALESAKAQSDINVTIDTAVGTTQSVGHMTTVSEKTTDVSSTTVGRPA